MGGDRGADKARGLPVMEDGYAPQQ